MAGDKKRAFVSIGSIGSGGVTAFVGALTGPSWAAIGAGAGLVLFGFGAAMKADEYVRRQLQEYGFCLFQPSEGNQRASTDGNTATAGSTVPYTSI